MMEIKINGVDQTDYYLSGRVKFDRPEGAIGHTEIILDFHKAVTVARKDELEITKNGKTMYCIVEKITNTKNTNQKRVVAKDYIYFKKDMPLPAVVFVDVHLSDICAWFVSQGIFDAYSIVPSGYVNPVVPFYFIEEDTKLSEVLKDIAQSIQGRVFTDVTDPVYKGKKIRFQFAALKTYDDTPLMAITEDQWESHEISDLPRQHNAFTLKFKKKSQIQDSLVFRGASYEDTYEVPNGGYPTGDDQYFAEFENPVIAVTDHSFDSREVVIDQTTWRNNLLVPDPSDANYGTLKDPFKMELKFLCNSSIGGTVYDFRIYGTAIKQDEMTETIDISGTDFKKEKEISSELISTDSDWHRKTIAWLAAKKIEKQTLTVVDPSVNFVDMMAVNAGPLNNIDNTIVDVDGIKVDVNSATWTFEKNTWNLSGYTARDPGTVFSYIEKMKSNDALNKTQRQLISAFEKEHPDPDTPTDIKQLIEIPNAENVSNYVVDVEPVYFKSVQTDGSGNLLSGTVNYLVDQQLTGKFNFTGYSEAEASTLNANRWLDSVAEDVWSSLVTIYPNDPSYVNPNDGTKMKNVVFEIKDINNQHYTDFEFSFEPLLGIKAKYKWTFRGYVEGGPEYQLWVYLYDLSGNFLTSKTQCFEKDSGTPNPTSFNLKSIKPIGNQISPLEGRFRFKVYQDINSRSRNGIDTTIRVKRSGVPILYSVTTIPDSSTPSFSTSIYSINSAEKYTKISFKNSSGYILKSVHLPVYEGETDIEFIAYRFTTHDDFTYIDYKTNTGIRKTLRCYDPDSVITSFTAQEVI